MGLGAAALAAAPGPLLRRAAGQRVPDELLASYFSGRARRRRGAPAAAELSGRCRSRCGRCCGAAPGVRRGWKPRLGGSRVGWGLLLLSEGSGRAERRERGEDDPNYRVFRGAAASGRPEHPQSAVCFPMYSTARKEAQVVVGLLKLTALQCYPCAALVTRSLLTQALPVEKGSGLPGVGIFFPSVVFFSLGIVFLQVRSDFLAPSFKNLVLRTLPQVILYYLKAVLFFLLSYEALPFILLLHVCV